MDILNADVEAGETRPEINDAQLYALRRMKEEAEQGGMGVQDRAALAQAQNETARRERGSREAILQNMAMRGQSGGGTELAASLSNQQGSADRSSAAGTQAAADARRRALEATAATGSMAGSIRGQDDSVNEFNAAQRLRQAGMAANVRTGQANAANADANLWTNRGAGAGSGVGGLLGFFGADDPTKKKALGVP
jgi:hypothetical protein